jgi:hypothetical protein
VSSESYMKLMTVKHMDCLVAVLECNVETKSSISPVCIHYIPKDK